MLLTSLFPPRFIRHDVYRAPNAYRSIKQRADHHLASKFLNRLFGDSGNPARLGYTGRGTEIRVSEPSQPHTYTQGKKPQPTVDFTGPAAGPSPKAAPTPTSGSKRKGKGGDGKNTGKQNTVTKASAVWDDPDRPSNVPLHIWRMTCGWKRKELD